MSTRHSTNFAREHAKTLAVLLALSAPLFCQAAVQAQLDRAQTPPGQPLTLSITSDSPSGGVQPDLAPLQQDFQVLATSTGSETSIINGQRSNQQRWDISLLPKHAGHITIPPLTVGADRTQALEVEVAPASPAQQAADAQHAFLEVNTNAADAANSSPYVQQQIPYTIRLFYDDSVAPVQLNVPAPANALVDQLGSDKHYKAIRHGHGYNVIERDYAIEPQQSGTLVIASPSLRGTEAVAGAASSSTDSQDQLFSRLFANTPFANMPGMRASFGPGSAFGGDTRPITVQGRQVTLEVKPRPAGIQGGWLPAEQLSLQDSWAGGVPALKVGEPVTRVISIQAKGLAASQIPALSIAAPANARVYPEAPVEQSSTDGQDIYGNSKQSVTYIPTQAGAMDVLSIDLTWWDVQHNVQRHATLPAFHLQVAPGEAGTQAAPPPPVAAPAPVPTDEPHALAASKRRPVSSDKSWALMAGLAVFVALVGALLASALRRRAKRSRGLAVREEPNSPPRAAATLRDLRNACSSHVARAAAQVLLSLAANEWPHDPPRGLGALADRLESGRDEVLELDRCLYGSGEAHWNGDALWQAVQGGLRPARSAPRSEAPGLDPLYPQAAR